MMNLLGPWRSPNLLICLYNITCVFFVIKYGYYFKTQCQKYFISNFISKYLHFVRTQYILFILHIYDSSSKIMTFNL